MAVSRKKLSIVLIIGAVLFSAALLQNWYYNKYLWPENIQRHIFGDIVVDSNNLVKRVGSSAFGEGVFTWEYRVDENTILEYCSEVVTSGCAISINNEIEPGVTVGAEYSGGTLKLYEIWS